MGPPGPGWYLNSSHQTDARLDLLDRAHDLTVVQRSSWVMATASYPWLVAVDGVTITCFTFIVCIYSTSHHPDNVWNRAM